MRSLRAAFGAAAIFLLFTPVSAQAWWGWLDDLSGPGPFWGRQYEIRAYCFGPEDQKTKTLADALFKAKVATYRSPNGANDEVQRLWREFDKALDDAKPVLAPLDVANFKSAMSTFLNRREVQRAPSVEVDPAAADLIAKASSLVEQSYKANVSIDSTGVSWSFCSPDSTRNTAIEIGATFWQANSNPAFARDYTVRLITLMPSISYRLFKDPTHDAVDIGAGAGIYWFSSRGFNAFSGLLLQPARVDVHGPTSWLNAGGLRTAIALLTLRAGVLGFPGGFEAGAFGPGTKAIGADFRPTLTVFVDVAPLLRSKTLK
jgi:hypothetical protein